MSFPGGKIEVTDESAKMAAIREVEEEVGLALTDVDYIGQIDDVYGLKVDNQYSVHVSCFVFKPSSIDSRIPEIDTKNKLSVIARQSSSARSTALPRLPVIKIGS